MSCLSASRNERDALVDVLVRNNLVLTLRHLQVHLPSDLIVRESRGG
jgi:hypothetical protein